MPAKKSPRSKPAAAPAPKPSRVRKTTARKPTAPAQPAPAERARGFPIVGIGASAGGLEALDELFAEMPADTGMAFVVITHQHPGHTSLLPELLSKITRIKAHPGYTEAIGQDLNIIGAEQTVDTGNAKPALKLELAAGHPNVKWPKGAFDAVEIWVDRGAGSSFLAIDTVPDYLDTAPLPAPGASAVWKYKAIYRLNDTQVGQWSDVVSIAVQG